MIDMFLTLKISDSTQTRLGWYLGNKIKLTDFTLYIHIIYTYNVTLLK